MTQIAMIVHHLMGEPETWIERGDSITNNYYTVHLDGSKYGMGAASYPASGADRDMLTRALDVWKQETGWEPKSISYNVDDGKAARPIIAPDQYIRQAYEDFARSIKNAHRSFVVHGESSVLTANIQQAISKLDSVITPMEKIEGKRSDS